MTRLPIAFLSAAWGLFSCGQHTSFSQQAESAPIDLVAIALTMKLVLVL